MAHFTNPKIGIGTLLLIGLLSSLAYGQPKTGKPGESAPGQTLKRSPISPSSTSTALEGAIDPDKYIIGPGDKLEFGIWGTMENHQEVIVAPDGMVSLPSVGNLKVTGLTVSAAETSAREFAKSAYPRARITLRLTGVRVMKAGISGAVEVPGIYEVSAVDRLTSLIEKAGRLKQPDHDDQFDPTSEANYKEMTPAEQRRSREEARTAREARPEASLRKITITSIEGEVRRIDLQRYFATGDPEFNPILHDGDAVKVPLLTRQTGVINVFGAVKNPGEFEFLDGDKLLTLIELAGGFRSDAHVDDILIVRFSGNDPSRVELHANLGSASSNNLDLKADDRIFVRKKTDYRQKYQVTIKGEVKYPGTYSIENDKTKFSDIIAECGGITDRANLYSARVTRLALIEAEDPEYERLKALSVADMTEMEYEYFKIRSREEAPPVVVNFEKLIRQGDTSQDIVLQDKDEIDIPTLSPTVKVAGQVNSPGLIRYVEGEKYYYYIQKAGGYSWNARTGMQRLIKAHSGTWMKPTKSTPIEIGDTIFVPEKQEVDWWELAKDLLLVASQIATVLIMVKSL